MQNKIEILNNIIRTHNQFKENSALWITVSEVFQELNLEFEGDNIQEIDDEYCNVISFYALCFAVGFIRVSFHDFLYDGLKSGDIRKDGFIKSGKDKLLAKYGIDFKLRYYDTMENLPDGFYQMKIKSPHFMACYSVDGTLYLSDTSSRGIGVVASKKVSKKEFMWLLRIV